LSDTLDDNLVVVPRYPGMTRLDAIRLRFGVDEVPAGITAILLKNALPPDGVPYDWWKLSRESAAFWTAFAVCQRMALEAKGL
jgi:hypothetical protein